MGHHDGAGGGDRLVHFFALLGAPQLRAPFVRNLLVAIPLAVYVHLAAGGTALVTGPFQFSSRLRVQRVYVHRWLGRVYVASVLSAGTSGFVLARWSQGGWPAHLGFAVLAVAWVWTVARAYQCIRAGDRVDHRRWMIRNYSLTFAAVTLRIYLPAALLVGVSFDVAYPVIAWLCWIPNLIIADRWLVKA